jgi:SPP1 family predicted phage head-tail adaptor
MNLFPHTIDIEEYTQTSDGMGGHTETWSTIQNGLQAHVQPISGREYYQAQQIQNPVNMDVYTPYNEVIKPSMRVLYNGMKLNIISVIDQGGMNEIMSLKCATSSV